MRLETAMRVRGKRKNLYALQAAGERRPGRPALDAHAVSGKEGNIGKRERAE